MRNSCGARSVLVCTLTLTLLCPAWVRGGNVSLAWNPCPDTRAVGYNLYCGLGSGAYTLSVGAGTNLNATVTGLTPGLTYYFASAAYDTNGVPGVFSNEVTNRVPVLPSVISQPLTQTVTAGAPVTLSVSAGGDPPLKYQWVDGLAAIPGATGSLLSWPQIGSGNAGNYTVIVSNPWGSTTSAVATLTVIVPPLIVTQPQSQTVIAKAAAVVFIRRDRNCAVDDAMVLWNGGHRGSDQRRAEWTRAAASNGGNYQFDGVQRGGRGDQCRRHFDRDRSTVDPCPATIANGDCHDCGVVVVRCDWQRAIVASMVPAGQWPSRERPAAP